MATRSFWFLSLAHATGALMFTSVNVYLVSAVTQILGVPLEVAAGGVPLDIRGVVHVIFGQPALGRRVVGLAVDVAHGSLAAHEVRARDEVVAAVVHLEPAPAPFETETDGESGGPPAKPSGSAD